MPRAYDGGSARVIDFSGINAGFDTLGRGRRVDERTGLARKKLEGDQARQDRAEAQATADRDAASDFYNAIFLPQQNEQEAAQGPQPAAFGPQPAAYGAGLVGPPPLYGAQLQNPRGDQYDDLGLYWDSGKDKIDEMARTRAATRALARMDPRRQPAAAQVLQTFLDRDSVDGDVRRTMEQVKHALTKGYLTSTEPTLGPDGRSYEDAGDQQIEDEYGQILEQLEDEDYPWTAQLLAGVRAKISEQRTRSDNQYNTLVLRDQEVERSLDLLRSRRLDPNNQTPDLHMSMARALIGRAERDNERPDTLFKKVLDILHWGPFDPDTMMDTVTSIIMDPDMALLTAAGKPKGRAEVRQTVLDQMYRRIAWTPQYTGGQGLDLTTPDSNAWPNTGALNTDPNADPNTGALNDPSTPPPEDLVDPADLPKDILGSKLNTLAEIFAEGGLTSEQIDAEIIKLGIDPELLAENPKIAKRLAKLTERIAKEYKNIRSDVGAGAQKPDVEPGELVPGHNPRGRTGPGWKQGWK